MIAPLSQSLRLLYAAGPGNVIGTYHYWIASQDDPSQVSVTFSSQFYDVCRALNAQGYVISSCPEKKFVQEGQFTIEHRPIPLRNASGLLYHLGQLWYGFQLVFSAVRFGSDVVIAADGTTHWFVLSLLPWFGVQVIPTLHCVLWRKYAPLNRIEKLFLNFNRRFFTRDCTAILVASDDIAEQVEEFTGHQHQPLMKYLPLYRRTEFTDVSEPDEQRLPFRVLFVGRIEPNKGVFDLLEVAKRFDSEGRQDITFDLCGTGSALETLRLAAKEAGLEKTFICHGHCNKIRMRQMFSQSHTVIVPTRTDFVEGFNQVVVEGVLVGRPVVTSAVCPALVYVRDAVVEVAPNDVKGYGNALLKLCDSRDFYEEKRQGCLTVQEQFYDSSQSWAATLNSALKSGLEKKGKSF